MSITDYAGLKSSIVDWVNRPNLDIVTGDLIQLAEAELNRELTTRQMDATVTFSLQAGSQALPADFLAHISLTEPDSRAGREIVFVAEDYFDGLEDEDRGGPRVFTIVGDDLLFKPSFESADEPVDVKLRYRQALPALSDTNPSNWLLSKFPDAYLFAALAEASDYIADEARLGRYIARRDRAVQMINQLDINKITGRRRVRPSSAVA